jgi:hypothetical protein
VQAGSGQVTIAGARVAIAVPGGVIVVDSGSSADFTVSEAAGTEVDVSVGAVTVVAKQRERVRAGESAVLGKDGEVEVGGRSLPYADIALDPGQSIVVHDPTPPTAVRFHLGPKCPGDAVVETASKSRRGSEGRARGTKNVSIAFGPGANQYEVRCVEEGVVKKEPIASGKVTVVPDSGNVPLPNSAPRTSVEADGRRYTITYQNLLPAVSITWPRAPKSDHYTLKVSSGRGSKMLTTSSPSYRFGSGALLEGTHKLVFATATGATSRLTTVEVRFDNAAPKASLRSPGDRSFAPGASVTVAGVALPGWSVDVNGTALPTDGQQRFAGKTAAPADLRALAVRFSHADRGVHYYLRRNTASK